MTLTRVAEQFRQRTQTLRASLGDAIKEAADLHLGAMGVCGWGCRRSMRSACSCRPACSCTSSVPPRALRVMINLNDALSRRCAWATWT
jgi:hypothetical protein